MDNQISSWSYKREVSCRTINTILKYAQGQGKDAQALIRGFPYSEGYLSDTDNWVSRDIAEEVSRRLKAMFGDDEILYKVALATEKLHTLGFIDIVVRLIASPKLIIKSAPRLNKYFTKVDEIEIVGCSSSSATIRYYTKPGYEMTADDCYYTKGIFTVLPKIWGSGLAKLKEDYCSVKIDKKGIIKGKFYKVDSSGYVSEHALPTGGSGSNEPKIIGRLENDGTFKLGGTVYGAKHCLYHIWWPARRLWLRRILHDIFTKPKVLDATIEEMQRENDIIQQKYEELRIKNMELQKHYVETISALIHAIDAKDHYTQDHSINVSVIAEAIAKNLGLPPSKIENIRQACKLHDLGKIGIKDSVLLKPGKLSDEDWEEMKKHPILGAEIVKPLTFLSEVAVLIRQDHERWDGRGYPEGLKGEDIDIGARVVMVADAYDAMISKRPYRQPISKSEAIEEIKRGAGTQFDPKVVEIFLKIAPQLPE